MSSKRKKLFLTCAAILLVSVSFLTGCHSYDTLEKGDYNDVYARTLPNLSVKEDGSFRYLVMSDLHLTGTDTKKEKRTLNAVSEAVAQSDYDLVIVTGDLFEGYTSGAYDKAEALRKFSEIFEAAEQYWCFIAGNNDGEFCGDNEAIFWNLTKYRYCLVTDTPDVGGTGNYVLPILDSQSREVHRLVLFDSRMRIGKTPIYHKIDETQAKWLERVCDTEGIPVSLLMHIPPDISTQAIANGAAVQDVGVRVAYAQLSTGNDNEVIAQTISSNPNIGLIGSGHLHSNVYVYDYRDRYWLSVPAGGFYGGVKKNIRRGAIAVTLTQKDDVWSQYAFSQVFFE